MSVTFAAPVSSNTGSVSLSGVTLGQPIILIVDVIGPSITVSDDFAIPYTWTKVDQGNVFSSAGLATVYQTMLIGTGGYGASGTIEVTSGNFITAVACAGASGANGLAAIDVHGNNTANNSSAGSPTLTPTTTGEGAVVAIYPAEFPNFAWVSAHPSSPWVPTDFLPSGYVHPPVSTATYASPPASAITAAWVQSNPGGSPDLNYITVGAVIKAFTAIAPNAPSCRAPVGSSFVDVSGGYPFAPAYNPADNTPMQSYQMRIKLSGGTYGYWNGTNFSSTTPVTMTLSALPGQQFTVTIPNGVAMPGGTFANGHVYNYSFACSNSAGTFGSFASDVTFTAQAPPVTTISAPASTVHGTTQPTITWSSTFPSGAAQITYRVIVESGTFGSTPGSGISMWDSGAISSSTILSVTVGVSLPLNTSLRAFVLVTETGGEPGVWAHSDFTLVADLPAAPTIVAALVTTDPTTGLPEIKINGNGNDNLLTANQSSMEGGVTGLIATLNCSINPSTTQALDGTNSMRMSSTTSGRMDAGTPSGTSGIPVIAGQTYTAMASFRSAITSRSCLVYIFWFNAAGAGLGANNGAVVTDLTTGWLQATATAVAPVGAAYAQLICSVQSPSAANENHYVDELKLAPGASTVWSVGGFVGTTEIVILCSDGRYVRGASPSNPLAITDLVGQSFTVYDTEAPTNEPVTYDVFVVATNSGNPLTGNFTSTSSLTIPATVWWFWSPANPSSAVGVNLASKITATLASGGDAMIEIDQDEDQGVFMPFGRQDTLVVHGDMRGEYYTLGLVFTSDAQWNAFKALRALQSVVAVRSTLNRAVDFMTIGSARPALILRGDVGQAGGPNLQATISFLPSVRPTP